MLRVLEECPQCFVDGRGGFELLRDIGLQNYDVGPFEVALVVFAVQKIGSGLAYCTIYATYQADL